MKKLIIIGVIVLLLIVVLIYPYSNKTSLTNLRDFQIYFTSYKGGYAPIFLHSLIITGDGKVVFDGKDKKVVVSQEKIRELIAQIKKIQFFILNDDNFPVSEAEPDFHTIQITMNGEIKEITYDPISAPMKIINLEKTIFETTNADQWIN